MPFLYANLHVQIKVFRAVELHGMLENVEMEEKLVLAVEYVHAMALYPFDHVEEMKIGVEQDLTRADKKAKH